MGVTYLDPGEPEDLHDGEVDGEDDDGGEDANHEVLPVDGDESESLVLSAGLIDQSVPGNQWRAV